MDHFTLSLAVGAVAGTLDIIPMIFQRLPMRSCLSAFFIYFFAAVIVFYSDLPYLPWWADGMAVTLMLTIPVLFTFSGRERKAIPVVLFNALLFGFLISAAEKYLAGGIRPKKNGTASVFLPIACSIRQFLRL